MPAAKWIHAVDEIDSGPRVGNAMVEDTLLDIFLFTFGVDLGALAGIVDRIVIDLGRLDYPLKTKLLDGNVFS